MAKKLTDRISSMTNNNMTNKWMSNRRNRLIWERKFSMQGMTRRNLPISWIRKSLVRVSMSTCIRWMRSTNMLTSSFSKKQTLISLTIKIFNLSILPQTQLKPKCKQTINRPKLEIKAWGNHHPRRHLSNSKWDSSSSSSNKKNMLNR